MSPFGVCSVVSLRSEIFAKTYVALPKSKDNHNH